MPDMVMKLYTVRDVTEMVFKALQQQGVFPIISVEGRGEIEATQRSGIVSQNFKIKIESADKDPV